mmetsp:Transcript_19185/g.44650  ORF Transcript_19185/g.44650 Transcript_19185/m.44650 type:complete len:178 (+) Transcript_19185:312-845(+)
MSLKCSIGRPWTFPNSRRLSTEVVHSWRSRCLIWGHAICSSESPQTTTAGCTVSSHRRRCSAQRFPWALPGSVWRFFSGPPTVVFKWRHFGKYTGMFTDKAGRKYKGNGHMLSIVGMCIAKVNLELQITGLDVYYNPEELTKLLTTMIDTNWRAFSEDPTDGSTPGGGCQNNSCVVT